MQVRLDKYNNKWFTREIGAGKVKIGLWYIVNSLFFQSYLVPLSGVKTFLLRCFGARIGKGVVIKPGVTIKYPWKLTIGDFSWIGEKVWIDNLAMVTIGAHCCLSQGAFLLTGNHDYRSVGFDLSVSPIILEDGVWIGAMAVVCPGIICHTHSVLAVQSTATTHLEPFTIYQGNPALGKKKRVISSD